MTCSLVRSKRERLSEKRRVAFGDDPEWEEQIGKRMALPAAHPDHLDDPIIGGELFFMCGEGVDETVCLGCDQRYAAEFLCDYPVGGGKRCDLPLCPGCAAQVDEDRHFCPTHIAEHRGKAGTVPIQSGGLKLVAAPSREGGNTLDG